MCAVIGWELHFAYIQNKEIADKRAILAKEELVIEFPYNPILIVENGCYIASTGFKDSYEACMQLKGHNHQARIMYVDHEYRVGHAVCVFEYEGVWHCYDSRSGTKKLGKFEKFPEPEIIAKLVNPEYTNAQWYP